MAFDKELDKQISEITSGWGATRKKMFGGTCQLINGNMMCGVYREFLILRLGEEQAEEAMKSEHVKPFDITGRPMKGWVMVEKAGFEGGALNRWLEKARFFTESLPSK